ncbi:hypothetical protein [Klebsiella pneumoniae]|nr:hypothetical protein [Klebsiella pneumoniae]SVW67795.1 Uncharacterised protein [Klebsiella pneumoniae]
MSISTTKHRNEEVNVGLSDRRKAEITAPKFDLFGALLNKSDFG